MDKKYDALFTPWKIGNCEIKNRIVLTSMGGTNLLGWMENNHFDKAGAEFILEVAKNNVYTTNNCPWSMKELFGTYTYCDGSPIGKKE